MSSGGRKEANKAGRCKKPFRADWNETETPHISLELWVEKKANSRQRHVAGGAVFD